MPINLSVSGLPSPNTMDFIFNLNTKILFPNSSFSVVPNPTTASGLTPGTILANSLQRANFDAASSLTAGAATGNFSQSPNANSGAISLNGLYYSFVLTAKSAGNGTISFDPTLGRNQYAANETGFNFAPLNTNGSLAFTISPAAPAVPEPGSVVLLAGMGIRGAGFLLRRKQARNAA